ncbi:MAG: type I 3-dehydroquinate dehydratase [Chloroflexota bacterium]
MSASLNAGNRIAVSLAAHDTDSCLAILHQTAAWVGLAEVCLDGMASFDLPRIVGQSPCPLIVTCRPPREGGAFSGSEAERIGILAQAMALGCAYVDVEWDSLAALRKRSGPTRTRLIVSRHWMETMPGQEQLWQAYCTLRPRADVVKLVGKAHRLVDVLPILGLLRRADGPMIALAMGEAGRLTRLLAPCFSHSLLTFAAPAAGAATAPGQFSVQELVDLYRLGAAGPYTAARLHLCTEAVPDEEIRAWNAAEQAGTVLHVPVVIAPDEADSIIAALRGCLPDHITLCLTR